MFFVSAAQVQMFTSFPASLTFTRRLWEHFVRSFFLPLLLQILKQPACFSKRDTSARESSAKWKEPAAVCWQDDSQRADVSRYLISSRAKSALIKPRRVGAGLLPRWEPHDWKISASPKYERFLLWSPVPISRQDYRFLNRIQLCPTPYCPARLRSARNVFS